MSKAEEWLFFAESDLKVADVILNEGIYNEVCFHAQQAVEKSFKAILFIPPTRYPDMLVGSLEESLPSKEEAERAVCNRKIIKKYP